VKKARGKRSEATGEFTTRSVRQTLVLGERLAAHLKVGDCVALDGELGAGKTVLVRGIAAGLGVKDHRLVSSPTFVLVQEYPADVPVYHVDLYRLPHAPAELADLGIAEMLQHGVVLIEWAARAGPALPSRRWQIDIAHTGKRARKFVVKKLG
jgi:tRNA threonylcarbamoyl adenosine modification protein YjeE